MIHLLTGKGLIVLGFLIKYFQWTFLIAGYNTSSRKEKAKYDKTALCNGVGNVLFLLGGLLLIASLGEFMGIVWLVTTIWILFTIVIIGFVIYANTGNRFKK